MRTTTGTPTPQPGQHQRAAVFGAAEFDYTWLLLRQDPHAPAAPPPARWEPPSDPNRFEALHQLEFSETLPALAHQLHLTDVHVAAAAAMSAVQHHFARRALSHGVQDWGDEDLPRLAGQFIAEPDQLDVRLLRRNALHSAELSLLNMHLISAPLDLARHADVRRPPANLTGAVRRRVGTHDEQITLRLAAPQVADQHPGQAAAVLAVLSGTATTYEACALTTTDAGYDVSAGRLRLQLPGFRAGPGGGNKSIAARIVDCDGWQHRSLLPLLPGTATASAPAAADVALGSAQYAAGAAFLLCRNSKRENSQSAQVAISKLFAAVALAAGLQDEPGFTPTSVRRWGAARDVTDIHSACAAAYRLGLPVLRLHAEIVG